MTMETKMQEEAPRPVLIVKIEIPQRNFRIASRTGEFVGYLTFDSHSKHPATAINVILDDGTFAGYLAADRVGEVLDFIGHRDNYQCKGCINSEYDRFREMFYFWGECVIPSPSV